MTNETRFVSKNVLYHGKRYCDEYPEFCYYVPEFTGFYVFVDCLVLNEKGETHPHYEKAVPIRTQDLGEPLAGGVRIDGKIVTPFYQG